MSSYTMIVVCILTLTHEFGYGGDGDDGFLGNFINNT